MSIKITKLGRDSKLTVTKKTHTFKDVYFELSENQVPDMDEMYAKTTRTDIQHSIDEGAILNSLRNIFTTTPGQKVLNPTFGVNLTQWLFQPADQFTAREIGEAVKLGIEKFEPRVRLQHVDVIVDTKNDQYIIQLAIQIPALNISKTYRSALMQNGFEFITNE